MKPFTTIAAVLVLIGMTAAAHAQQPQQPQSYVVASAPRAYYQPQYLATPTPAVRLPPLPAAVRFCPQCRQYHQ